MHISQLYKTIEKGEFSISFVAKDGELITIGRCIMSSWHTLGITLNVKIIESGEVRTINRYTITAINKLEMYL